MPSKQNYVVLDIETQNTFDDVGGKFFEKLDISVVCLYQNVTGQYHALEEKELGILNQYLSETDLAIGFNIKGFDYPVLQRYLQIPLQKINTLDIMDDLKNTLGHRVSLNSVAQATLGTAKTGDGLEAVRLYRLGEIEKIKEYCTNDVRLTKEVYEFGLKNHFLRYTSKFSNQILEAKVNWTPILKEENLLF